MRESFVHGDDRIAQQHEIGPETGLLGIGNEGFSIMSAKSGSQVPSGGEACDAYLPIVNTPFGSVFPNKLYGALCVLKGANAFIFHDGIVGQTVFHYKSRNSLFSQSLCNVVPLMIDRQDAVSAARKDDNGFAGILFFQRKIGNQLRLTYLRNTGYSIATGFRNLLVSSFFTSRSRAIVKINALLSV